MRSTNEALLRMKHVADGDDSAFISAADFFSLLSMTLIYAMLSFAPASPGGATSTNVVPLVHEDLRLAVHPDFANVAVVPFNDQFVVRVLRARNKDVEQRIVSLDAKELDDAIAWLEKTLGIAPLPRRVVFYLDETETRPEVHKTFNRMLRETQREYSVSQVFRNDQAPK